MPRGRNQNVNQRTVQPTKPGPAVTVTTTAPVSQQSAAEIAAAQLSRQRVNFAVQDAEDYIANLDVYTIAPSRQEIMIEKLDELIGKLDQICDQQVINGSVRKNIRDLKYKLERKANNLTCLMDKWEKGIIDETEDEDDEEVYDDYSNQGRF